MESKKESINFYVNDKLEFSFWGAPEGKSDEDILKWLYDSHDWQFMAQYCKWKVTKVKFSDNRGDVYIQCSEGEKYKKEVEQEELD